jgi:hypothetical protein
MGEEEKIITLQQLETEYPDIYKYLIRQGKQLIACKQRNNDTLEVITLCDNVSIFFKQHEFFVEREDKEWSPNVFLDYYSVDVKFNTQTATITATTQEELLLKLSKLLKAMVL